MTDPDLAALLRQALRDAAGNSPADEHLRASIRAGVVGDDPALLNVYEQEAGPEQAEVDLHLDGPGIESHTANAKQFARFVSGMSEAVKQTAKSLAGRERYGDNLRIEGATPGSVRVVFRVARQEIPVNQTADPSTAASSVDSDALRTVATILGHASDEDPDSPLAAEVAELPPGARQALKRVVAASLSGGWGIHGSIRQRRVGRIPLDFTSEGAVRLQLELETQNIQRREAREVGRIDGFRWSLGSLYFVPAAGRPFTAGVVDGEVAHRVTELMSNPDQPVVATFDVVESYAPGARGRPGTSRVLKQIEVLGRQQELTIDELRQLRSTVDSSSSLRKALEPPKKLPPPNQKS
ncbi:hypothetical protein [Gordonia sp. GN26]